MPTITNTGKAGRGLPKTSMGGKIVEIGKGESVEFSQADWDAIKDRVTIKANIADGSLKVTGDAPAPAPVAMPTVEVGPVIEVLAAVDTIPAAPAPKARGKAAKEAAQ